MDNAILKNRLTAVERQLRKVSSVSAIQRMHGDLNMGGHRIVNIGQPLGNDDAVTGASGAPQDASYLVIGLDADLTAERKLVAGTNITITDGGAGGNLTIAAAGGSSTTMVVGEALTGTGTTFTLANTPNSDAEVALFFAGVRLEKVASGPNAMQFTISGANITLGLSKNSADSLFADYLKAASSTVVVGEIPSGSGTSFTLANTPSTDASVALYMAGVRLEKVAATPNAMQFTISGTGITTGLSKAAGDSIFADYLY